MSYIYHDIFSYGMKFEFKISQTHYPEISLEILLIEIIRVTLKQLGVNSLSIISERDNCTESTREAFVRRCFNVAIIFWEPFYILLSYFS